MYKINNRLSEYVSRVACADNCGAGWIGKNDAPFAVDDHAIGQSFHQQAVTFLTFLQDQCRPRTLPFNLCILDSPFNCRSEPVQMGFHDIIVSSGFHYFNNEFFAQEGGNHDERNIKIALFVQSQRR